MGEWRNVYRGCTENAMQRDRIGDLAVDGRTVLKWIVENGTVRTG
jgi:hypothetical protein